MVIVKKKKLSQIIPGELGYFNNHVKYYQRMKDLLKAKQTQVDLLSHRRKSIQDSNILNYQNEYNRLRGVIESQNPGLMGHTIDSIVARQKQLENLGALATQANSII